MGAPTRRITRAGILGDVHAEDARLVRAYRAFDAAAVDAVLCVGDVVDGPGDPDACVALLARRGALVVAGNHDRWFLADELRNLPEATQTLESASRDQLLSWPTTLDFDTPRGRLRLAHGVDGDDMAELRPDTRGYALQASGVRDLMLDGGLAFHVGGHTHVPMIRAFPGLVALNPGTLTGEEPLAMVVDFERGEVVFFDLRADDACEARRVALPSPLPTHDGG